MKLPDPKPISFYAEELREFIPKEAFKPATYKLFPMFIHVALIGVNLTIIKIYPTIVSVILCSIFLGFSIACLFLYSHELSHGTIVRKQPLLYLLQLFFWSFSGIPPTVWDRVHNSTHHKHMNTYNDPDRKTFKSEANAISHLYNLFIYPNKKLRYSLTVGFAMMFYSTKHALAVFYQDGKMPKIVTSRPRYTTKEKRKVLLELFFILSFWLGMGFYVGFPIAVLVYFISWLTYSTGVITFIITQHLRDSVFISDVDPLLTTTSVKIPRWLEGSR